MINKIKLGLYHIYMYIFKNTNKYIYIYWFNGKVNFGDSINLYIIKNLSKKKPIWIYPKYWLSDNYLCIGSILQEASRNSLVWGSGFISDNISQVKKPKKIYAVRGPKTRQKLLDLGIDCPKVYGDPALLLPKIYSPKIEKKYKLGIIPHYVDKGHSWLKCLEDEKDIKLLDIQEHDPLKFIDDLLSCKNIASSSLHGLIVSDAYGIPSIWIKLSNNIVGDDFKFYDYFESVKRLNEKPIKIISTSRVEDILKFKKHYKIDIDLDRLMESCPFR